MTPYESILKILQNTSSTELMIVSKNQPIEKIQSYLDLGHRFFGENRVQESLLKWPSLREQYHHIRLHLIGPLQRNKVRKALELFDAIETIDRHTLVDTLSNALNDSSLTKLTKNFLIQVNTGNEQQKSGVSPAQLPELLNYCEQKGLPISGLMCIPPQKEDSEKHFMLLKELALKHDLPKLSMGMSQDYQTAASLGASWVRIGTALFS